MLKEIISVDVRRPANRVPRDFQVFIPHDISNVYSDPNEFAAAYPSLFSGCPLLILQSGDGIFGEAVKKIVNAKRCDYSNVFIAWMEGGTTMCALKIAREHNMVEIPQHLSKIFPAEHFQANMYYPPVISSYNSPDNIAAGKPVSSDPHAYLDGFCHVTVSGVKYEMELEAQGVTNPKTRYEQAGIKTMGTIFNRVEPEYLAYTSDGQHIELPGPFSAAFVMSGRHFAAFSANITVPKEKVLLVAVRDTDNLRLAYKHLKVLLNFRFRKDGFNYVLKSGLAESYLADSVIVFPDQKAARNGKENYNRDGQLSSNARLSVVYRSPDPVTVISPRV